jgi:UDP-N-acetyl-D-glucosamine/UDP-N-acetyl-D-galactosamine dehydrogenase
MSNKKICIVGLGYVGLPLVVAFTKVNKVTAFDINVQRIAELQSGYDKTLEVDAVSLNLANSHINYVSDIKKAADCDIYIITVPTPISENKKPDLSYLKLASEMVGGIIDKENIIIYESTVYPGATEDFCVPILEQNSELKLNKDFYCGYSPERINPGDRSYRLEDIVKVTSGSNPTIAIEIDELYQKIIPAGTHKARSIKVAEAAKVIENTQRDLNIALINELAIVCNKLNIDTESVLEAAGTKWNFLPFRPGLVGGHCIGVDPYYLTHKSIEMGYVPEVILAGRKLNDNMGIYIVSQVTELMISKSIEVKNSNVLIMGLAFKENCPDFRNTMVSNMIEELNRLKCNTDIYDPWVNKKEVFIEHGITLIKYPENKAYDAIIIAVAHEDFKELGIENIKGFGNEEHIIYDVKHLYSLENSDGRL